MPGAEVTIGNAAASVIQLPLETGALRQADDAVLHKG
jgi:hypothetical protein